MRSSGAPPTVSRLELRVLRLEDGRDLAFADYGDPQGAVVFGFHGTPGSHRHIEPLAAAATRVGVRLIAPDRPGYGHSTFSPARALSDWPKDVLAIADELGVERFGVFGVSGGGPHAAACAHQLGEFLTGCVIVSGSASLATHEDAAGMKPINRMFALLARRAPVVLRVPFGAINLAARLLPASKLREQMLSDMPPADVAIASRPEIERALLDGMRHKHLTAAKAAAQDFTLLAKPWGFALEQIRIPVHLWHGGQDVNVPLSHAKRQAELIADSTLHLADDKGHMLLYEQSTDILETAAGRSRHR